MEIVCNNCGKRYIVDDSKLPDHGSVIIKCKNCSEKIRVQKSRQDDTSQVTPQPAPPGPEETAPTTSAESGAGEQDDGSEAMEYFPEDAKTALVFCTDFDARNEIEKHLQTAGYEFRHITTGRELEKRFRYHIYNLIILYQSGPEPSPALKEILDIIARLPGPIRRKIITMLIMLGGNQHDEMLSFSMSMNMTISPTDLSRLPEIISRAEERHDQTYRIFFDCLEKVAEKHL